MKKYKLLIIFLSLIVVIYAGLVWENAFSLDGNETPNDMLAASFVDIPRTEVPLGIMTEETPAFTAGQIGASSDFIPASALPSTGKQWNVLDFGAKGDGKTDDTEAFRSAVASASAYDTVYAPRTAKEYVLTDTLTINKNIHFVVDGGIVYKGPKDRTVISTENLLKCRVSIASVRDNGGDMVNEDPWGGYHGYESPNYTGVMMTNSKWTSVSIGLSANFTNGVVCRGMAGGNGNGFWFNSINISDIKDCLTGLELRCDGSAGWVNSNVFYNTSFTLSNESGFRSSGKHYVDVRQSNINGSSRTLNSNIFYNFRFEITANTEGKSLKNGTTYTSIYLRRASNWSFVNYRTELVGNNIKFCVIDFEGIIGTSDKSGMTWGLSLTPVNHMYIENEQVEIINAVELSCPISEIYQFPSPKQYTIKQDTDLRSKFLRVRSNQFALRGYSFIQYSSKGGELLESYIPSASTLVTDNNIVVDSSVMLGLTLPSLAKDATVELDVIGEDTHYAIFCFRRDGTQITSKYDSQGVCLLAMDGYFADKDFKAFRGNSSKSRTSFSVLSDEVDNVVIGLFGKISGYSIMCDKPGVQVLRYRVNSNLNNYQEYFAATKPTLTTGIVGTRVFHSADPSCFWQLEKEDGVKKWIFVSDAEYGIGLSESGTYVFGAQNAPYSPVAARSVTISNMGSEPTGALTVALSGANPSSFMLSKTSVSSIATGGTGSFTIKPIDTLEDGDYSAVVTVSGNNITAQTFNVSFTVGSAQPVISEVTINPYAVTVEKGATYQFNATVGGTNDPNQNVSWSVSGGVAQTSISASGLLSVAAEETSSTLTVIATSTVDGSKSGASTVTVTQPDTPVAHTINYNANGGSGTMPGGTVVHGDSYTVAGNSFERENCSFSRWTTLTDGNGADYAEGDTIYNVQTDITLYAQWDLIGATDTPNGNDDPRNDDNEGVSPTNMEPTPLSK